MNLSIRLHHLAGLIVAGLIVLDSCAPVDSLATQTAQPTDGSSDVAALLDKTWRLQAMLVGGEDVALDAAVSSTIRFASDGTYSGNGGCNSYGGQYSVDRSGSIRLGQATATLMACPAGMEQEGAFFAALENVSVFQVDANGLQLSSTDGKTVLTLLPG